MPIRIFISYARKHEGFVRQLATALSNSGAEVWVDIEDIPAGMNWSRAVQEGLDACDVMLVIISPESMDSRNVENEWQYYFDENKPVIPIRLVDAKTHFQLRRLQYIDFERQPFDAAYAQLLRELARLGFALTPLEEAPAESPILPGVPLTEQSPIRPSASSPLPLDTSDTQPEMQDLPAERLAPPLYEVETEAGGEVNKKTIETPPQPVTPDPQNIELRNKYAAPPKPARRSTLSLAVLLVGIAAALVIVAFVILSSFNRTMSPSTVLQTEFPDLMIQAATIPNAPVAEGDTVQADISIKNEGSAASGAFSVRVNLNGAASDQEQAVENLDPLESITLTFYDTALDAGDPEAHFFVDVYQQVDESEEGNNSTTLRYDVVDAPEMTAEATEATAEATEPVAFASSFNPDVVRFKNRALIVYASQHDGDFDLYLYDTGSHEIVPLTVNDCNDRQPSWSPDGEGIIFISDCDGNDDEIFIFDELGVEQRQVTFDDLHQSSPVWVTDEIFYYWMHPDNLDYYIQQAWSMSTQGIGISQLTDTIQDAGEVLTASPDGAYLAYTQSIDERPRLVLYDIETRTPQFVGDPEVDASKPRWSPNSNQIIYVGYELSEGVDRLTTYNVDSDSYEWWAISHDEILYPSWNPYTDTLLLAVQVSNGDFTSGLYVFDREEDEPDLLIEDETITSPHWRPNH